VKKPPILGVAPSLTLLIQGYASVRLGILEARCQRDLGIAGVIARYWRSRGRAGHSGLALCCVCWSTAKISSRARWMGHLPSIWRRRIQRPANGAESPTATKRVTEEAMADW